MSALRVARVGDESIVVRLLCRGFQATEYCLCMAIGDGSGIVIVDTCIYSCIALEYVIRVIDHVVAFNHGHRYWSRK